MINDISLLNDDTKNKIRTLFLNGKNFKEIQEITGISAGTWDNYYYLNKQGFRDYVIQIKNEKNLMIIEQESNKILALDTDDNAKLLAIKQKEMEFLRETIHKDKGYTKRIENIGFNLNKTEPLDEEQKEKLNKILKREDKPFKDVEFTEKSVESEQFDNSINNIV